MPDSIKKKYSLRHRYGRFFASEANMSADICRRLLDEDCLSSTHYLSSGFEKNIFSQSKKLDLSINTSFPTRIKNIRGESTIYENEEAILPLSSTLESPQKLREEVKKKRNVDAPSPDSVMVSSNEWCTFPSSNCTLGVTDAHLLSLEHRFEEQCRTSSVSERSLSRITEIDSINDPDDDFFLADNVILLVKKRQHTKDTEVLDVKITGDKHKSEADEGKHTEVDDLTEHLSFLEEAREGFIMAVQDIFCLKEVYIGDNTTANGSYNVHTYNSVPKEVKGPCVHNRFKNFRDDINENDYSFLDDFVSILNEYLGPING